MGVIQPEPGSVTNGVRRGPALNPRTVSRLPRCRRGEPAGEVRCNPVPFYRSGSDPNLL